MNTSKTFNWNAVVRYKLGAQNLHFVGAFGRFVSDL